MSFKVVYNNLILPKVTWSTFKHVKSVNVIIILLSRYLDLGIADYIVIMQIDWHEPWLWFLVGFHLLCTMVTMLTIIFNSYNTQIALFLVFCKFSLLLTYLLIFRSAEIND